MKEKEAKEKAEKIIEPKIEKTDVMKNNCSASIDSISTLGLMIVQFNESIDTSINNSNLNESIIDIYIEQYLQTNSSKTNLTWQVKEFKGRKLDI